MKRVALVVGSALLGIALCALEVAAFQSHWFDVRFPAPGGEDDFSLRAAAFLGGVCPAFLLLGGWVGLASSRGRLNWLASWAGAVCGFAMTFLVVRLLRGAVSSLDEPGSATHAVYAFFGGWVLLSAVGAIIGGRFRPRK
jgi:hypothetical protein